MAMRDLSLSSHASERVEKKKKKKTKKENTYEHLSRDVVITCFFIFVGSKYQLTN